MAQHNFKFLPKAIVVLAILSFATTAKAQLQIGSTFRPLSYEEMVRPIEAATQAFKEASYDLEEYWMKAVTEWENKNYKMSLFYFERCAKINRQFDYQICDQTALDKNISTLKNYFAKKEAREKAAQAAQPAQNSSSTVRLSNTFELPLRQAADVNSKMLTKLPPNAVVKIVEMPYNGFMVKVQYGSWIGYISKGWLPN